MIETLGQRITRLRGEHGMSQGDLADALDISRQSVSKWETDTSTPELEKLIRLAELFDISMDALILGKDVPQTEAPAAEPPPASPTPDTSVKLGCKREPISQTQKFVGLMLIGISSLFALICLVFFAWGGLLTALMLSSPLWGCGILCMTVRKRVGLSCCWLIYILVSAYLYYATGTSRGSIWNIQYWRYIDNPINLVMAATETILLLVLYLWSFFSFRKIRCPLRLRMKQLTGAYIGCIIGYIFFFVVLETWLPHFIVSRFFMTEVDGGFRLTIPDLLRTYTFITSIIDLFWILALIIGAKMLYNEWKASKIKIA